MDQKEFTQKTIDAHITWRKIIASFPKERMEEPGVCGVWSFKELIGHITWYEREMITMLHNHDFHGSLLWTEATLDERNEVIAKEIRGLTVEKVLEQSEQAASELENELAAQTDADLNDPARYPGMPAEWSPADVIAGNAFDHIMEHLPDVQKWLSAHH